MSVSDKNKENVKLKIKESCPLVYHLQLYGVNKRRKIIRLNFLGKECKSFYQPVTLSKTPKLYIIRNKKKEILYVGYADQSIGSRLRYGLNPKHQKNYHGYRWMMEKEVELLVWVFQSYIPGNKSYNTLLKRTIECIEAEIVYHLRFTQGCWPEYQREIHFGNENRQEVMKWAKRIIRFVTNE